MLLPYIPNSDPRDLYPAYHSQKNAEALSIEGRRLYLILLPSSQRCPLLHTLSTQALRRSTGRVTPIKA
jgi:type II secretory pathway component PulL